MCKMAIALTTTAAILFVGSLAWNADAQTARGAAAISTGAKNFTPIEKAATCGDIHCGPHRMLVCGVPPHWHCYCHWCHTITKGRPHLN